MIEPPTDEVVYDFLCTAIHGGRSTLDPPETFPGSPCFCGLLWIPVHIGVLPGSPAVRGAVAAFLGFPARKGVFPGSPLFPGRHLFRKINFSIMFLVDAVVKMSSRQRFENGKWWEGGRPLMEE